MASVLIRDTRRREMGRIEGYVKMEADWSDKTTEEEPPEAGRSKEGFSP